MSILTGITEEPRVREANQAGSSSGDDNFGQKFSYLLAVPKPIFMAINGPIAGIGLCLGVFGDFRYMAEGAKLTTAFAICPPTAKVTRSNGVGCANTLLRDIALCRSRMPHRTAEGAMLYCD